MLSCNITHYPIKSKEIARKNNWQVITIKKLANKLNIGETVLRQCSFYNSDAITFYNKSQEKYIIVYDNFIKPKERINWTIAHEIGHIALNHFHELNGPSNENLILFEDEIMELEADYFASQLLASPIILYNININNIQQIEYLCGITSSAANGRLKHLERWKSYNKISEKELKLLELFEPFLNELKTTKNSYISQLFFE